MRRNRIPIFRVLFFLGLFVLPLFSLGGSNSARAAAQLPAAAATDKGSAVANSILVLRVYYRNTAELNSLAQEFGVESPPVNGYITVWADQPSLDSLRARGLRVEIDADATLQANEPIVWGHNTDTFFNGYYTVEEMGAFLDAKAAAYPNLAEKVDFGDSWCKAHPGQCTLPNGSNGYDMVAMHITNRNIPGPKGVFWYNAGLHAREIVPPELAMLYISWLLDGYNTNPDARWLVDYQDIWIVPMSNPDGHHIAENGAGTPRTQRKNANNTNGCTTWPPGSGGQFGTDLNRNFIFEWACCNGSSGIPCDLTYRGPTPVSENETQAISNTVASLIPDQRGPDINDPAPLTAMGVFLDMHSNARLDLYPWGQTTQHAPNDADLHNIASHFGALNASPPGNGYTVQQSVGLYPTDGASDDSTYGMLGAAGFTIELNSGGSFTPPYSTVNTDWNANRGALIYLSKIARAPYLTTRGPDSSVVATNPMTVTQGTPSTLSGTMNYSWSGNYYLQNVAAAEYYIDSSPWTGGTPIAMTATDGNFNSPTEGVQAVVDTASLAPGRHLLLVRGRGINDYEGNHSWGAVSAAFLDVLPNGGPTWTPTVVPTSTPTATPWTPGPGCAALFGTGSTTCAAPSTFNYSFTFYNESGCTSSATGDANISIEVAQDMGGPYTSYDTQVRQVTFPQGPSYVTFTGTFTETNIPEQYNAYRFYFDASSVRILASATTTPNEICRIYSSATPTATRTATPTVTGTPPTATPSPTVCLLSFTDVPPGNTFYSYIRCLVCLGVINGYPDNTFRPGNKVTRGQFAKILSNSAGFTEPVSSQTFEDMLPGSTFYIYTERLASRGIVAGYGCGGAGEPCVPPGNRPYFRPNTNSTRGQISKMTALAAGFFEPAGEQQFEDVPPYHVYYSFIWWLASQGVMVGYPCGSIPSEPCIAPGNRPYFRPDSNATRGQTLKIVANTFFPGCSPPTRR